MSPLCKSGVRFRWVKVTQSRGRGSAAGRGPTAHTRRHTSHAPRPRPPALSLYLCEEARGGRRGDGYSCSGLQGNKNIQGHGSSHSTRPAIDGIHRITGRPRGPAGSAETGARRARHGGYMHAYGHGSAEAVRVQEVSCIGVRARVLPQWDDHTHTHTNSPSPSGSATCTHWAPSRSKISQPASPQPIDCSQLPA